MNKGKRKPKPGTWSPEARAKRKATFAARRAQKEALGSTGGDALAYLLKAESVIVKQMAKGCKRIGPLETLTMLALNALRGEL
jgi:hypothetical protein